MSKKYGKWRVEFDMDDANNTKVYFNGKCVGLVSNVGLSVDIHNTLPILNLSILCNDNNIEITQINNKDK